MRSSCSVDVQEYNPPHYQIAGDFVSVVREGSDEEQIRHYSLTVRYDWDTREAFSYRDGNWRKLCSELPASTPYRLEKLTANALFRAAYGMTFYED